MIEEHPGPLTYDLRERFGLSLRDLGRSIPWDESVWLVDELLVHPESHTTAALLGWEYPVSREWIIAALHLDFDASANKKNKPVPKPWKKGHRTGKTSLAPDDAKRLLARLAGREYPDGG